MSRVVRYLLERVTDLDLNLMGRFARRETHRAAEGLSQLRGLGPRGSAGADNLDLGYQRGRCLRGLETTWTSGWGLQVSAGALLLSITGDIETRPGTWSGRVERDDYSRAIGVLPSTTTATPASPPGGALAQYEYWLVYATLSEVTVETDSARKVFNQGTGVFDSASAAKVKQHQLALTVLRSAGNSPPDFTSVPAGGVVIALVYVPAGATDLSGAVIYDCRKLPELAPGPNRVGGCWQFSTEGEITSPYAQTVFLGRVHARLAGELLGARAYASAIQVGDLAEPGATWDAGAAPSTPKIAWLYLTKVGGVVPRPVRRGSSNLGHHGSYTAESVILDGALVLSPTPPRIGASVTAAEAPKSGLRWDLRPSAALTLPGFQRGDIPYRYQGLSVPQADAICVGFIRYTGVDSGTPKLLGSLHVDELGWMRGSSIAEGVTDPSGLFTSPTFTAVNGTAPRTLTSNNNYGFAQVTIGGVAFPLPLDGARMNVALEASSDAQPAVGAREDAGRYWRLDTNFKTVVEIERRQVTPGRPYLNQVQFTVSVSTWGSPGGFASLFAVRFPYGEDLVT